MSLSEEKTIIFFDGVCNLCNAFVDFLVQRDRQNKFYFSSLQGETAAQKLEQQDRQDLQSLVVLYQGKLYRRSRAVFIVCRELGGLWKVFLIFYILPTFILDSVYNWIAQRRYQFFGQRSTCRVPTAREREKFLN